MISYDPKNLTYARLNRKETLMTEAEWKFWNLVLKKSMTWYRFLKQKCVWDYILDFYCHELKIWIEIDWWYHDWNWERDLEKEAYLNSLWIVVLRYTNNQVLYQIHWLVEDLHFNLAERAKEIWI